MNSSILLLLLKIVQPRALIKLHEERVKAGNRDNGNARRMSGRVKLWANECRVGRCMRSFTENIILTFSVHIQKLMKTLVEIKWVDDSNKVWWRVFQEIHTYSQYCNTSVPEIVQMIFGFVFYFHHWHLCVCICDAVPNFAVMQMYVCL